MAKDSELGGEWHVGGEDLEDTGLRKIAGVTHFMPIKYVMRPHTTHPALTPIPSII